MDIDDRLARAEQEANHRSNLRPPGLRHRKRRVWAALLGAAGVVASIALMVLVGRWLAGGGVVVDDPAVAMSVSASSAVEESPTTIPATSLVTDTTANTPATPTTAAPPPTSAPFIPVGRAVGDEVLLEAVFADGTVADLSFDKSLDLVNRGSWSSLFGYIDLDEYDLGNNASHARQLWIRFGNFEDVLATFGGYKTLDTFETSGGTVLYVRSENWPKDFLVLDFDPWTLLITNPRREGIETPHPSDVLAEWAENIDLTPSDQGFPVVSLAEPLYYPEPSHIGSGTMLNFRPPRGLVTLTPGDCEPSSPANNENDSSWCDATGRLTIRVKGTDRLVEAIFTGLTVEAVTYAAEK